MSRNQKPVTSRQGGRHGEVPKLEKHVDEIFEKRAAALEWHRLFHAKNAGINPVKEGCECFQPKVVDNRSNANCFYECLKQTDLSARPLQQHKALADSTNFNSSCKTNRPQVKIPKLTNFITPLILQSVVLLVSSFR
jgi:hypothetical protein